MALITLTMAHQQIIVTTPQSDKPVMKLSLVIKFAHALFKPEVVWGSFLSSSLEDILALCLEKGSYYYVDIHFQHR